jgi:hypothetical protein
MLNFTLLYFYYSVNERLKKCVVSTEQEFSMKKAIWQQTLERERFTLQFNPEMLNLLLYTQGSPVFHLFEYAALNSKRETLFFYVPENVCAACLDKELELLIELKSENQIAYMEQHIRFFLLTKAAWSVQHYSINQ